MLSYVSSYAQITIRGARTEQIKTVYKACALPLILLFLLPLGNHFIFTKYKFILFISKFAISKLTFGNILPYLVIIQEVILYSKISD